MGVLWDEPRGSLALCRIELKHELRESESRVYGRCRESADVDRASGRLRKERGQDLVFAWDLGFLVCVPSQESQNWSKQRRVLRCPL